MAEHISICVIYISREICPVRVRREQITHWVRRSRAQHIDLHAVVRTLQNGVCILFNRMITELCSVPCRAIIGNI